MDGHISLPLPPRERQIAAIVAERGAATASEICAALPDRVSNAAVRTMLSRLEGKGAVRRRKEGRRFVYEPVGCPRRERDGALRRLARDHFGGSLADAAAALAELVERQRRRGGAPLLRRPETSRRRPAPREWLAPPPPNA